MPNKMYSPDQKSPTSISGTGRLQVSETFYLDCPHQRKTNTRTEQLTDGSDAEHELQNIKPYQLKNNRGKVTQEFSWYVFKPQEFF